MPRALPSVPHTVSQKEKVAADIMGSIYIRNVNRVAGLMELANEITCSCYWEVTTPYAYFFIPGCFEPIFLAVYMAADAYRTQNEKARKESMEILDILIRNGVDLNCHDPMGKTPIHLAENMGDENLMVYLQRAKDGHFEPMKETKISSKSELALFPSLFFSSKKEQANTVTQNRGEQIAPTI